MIKLLKDRIAKLKDKATERSYYPLLCSFFEEFGKSGSLKLQELQATPEETSTQYEKQIGFPDITIRNKNELIGWVEVKAPKENLNAEKFKEQFTKYKDSLENIIFTNLREWQLWQWEEGESKKTADVLFDLTDIGHLSSKEFESFLIKFFEGRVYQTRTPKQLALALAKKTRLLSRQVEEALEKSTLDSDLRKLKDTFEKTLIQNINDHQFANMVAETMAYSLFLAALEHSHRDKGAELTLTNAIDYLPTNVPILADLYSLIKKVAGAIPTIYEATRLLVDQLNASEIERIHQKLVEHKPGEDPVIQFYEPFLKEYDPQEREARGVYYTPKPVVDYIVKSVDWLLRNKFDKAKGLADESVNLLDPATGTGTFLMSAIQEIHSNVKKENIALGDEMVTREFNKVVLSHILKHFYGFELLIAPYAIAHLKLTLEVERLGFDFALTRNDGDPDNDRFKVYLANTLDDPNKPPQKIFGFNSIPQESENAREVKKNAPILAIVGNPPYSGISQNPVETIITNIKNGKEKKKKIKTWIGDLIEDYKYTEGDRNSGKHFKEKKHWLGDDYVKFIRFGQWKIEQNGAGVLVLITNHKYLDNPTFRGMRWQLMNTFDDIYILNLHGDAKTEKITPEGKKDENVFTIQKGVAISIFIKKSEIKSEKNRVFYSDLWGLRKEKFSFLLDNGFSDTEWKEIKPASPYYFFIPKSGDGSAEFLEYSKITDIFPINVTGIVTARDEFVIDYDKNNLLNRINDFCNPINSDDYIRNKYFGSKKSGKYLPGDTRGWKLSAARNKLAVENHEANIKNILYRPFDVRSIYYHPKIVDWGREKVMNQFIQGDNLGLVVCRQSSSNTWMHAFLTNKLVDDSMVSNKTKERGYCLPLYFDAEYGRATLLAQESRKPNLSLDFIKRYSDKLEFEFVSKGKGDLDKTFGPESVFYYAYTIFYSPTYRLRYSEQLKSDFPRLPLTADKELFVQLVMLGNELVNLHLLGENPFDKSKTIFDEPVKWGVKIGGTKPEKIPDWQVADIRYEKKEKRVYVNKGQYFEGIEKEVWEFMIGGYQVCDKWLKERKKAERALTTDDLKHYIKIIVSSRETIRIMSEIDRCIDEHGGWPIK